MKLRWRVVMATVIVLLLSLMTGDSVYASAKGRIKCNAISSGKVVVKASLKNNVKSSDNYYYLVRVSPLTDACIDDVAKTKKCKKPVFKLKMEKDAAYVQNKYVVAVKKGSKFYPVTSSSYVNQVEKGADNKQKYFLPGTKKGIQYTNFDELRSCGAKNTFLNLPVSSILTGNTYVEYKYNGRTYHFTDLAAYRVTVYDFNANNINVTLQLLLNWGDGSYTRLIDSRARTSGERYYTWNTQDRYAREEMEAIFSYLASIFGKKDCHVDNWILGNEVNACDMWNYRGGMSDDDFIDAYSYSFMSLYKAVRSQRANSKVFVCLDHTWGIATDGFGGKDFLRRFNNALKGYQKGIRFNIAYHAYPVPLYDSDYWNNGYTDNTENSKYITLQNLNVLTSYVKKHYTSKTRIILSEQGFTVKKGEAVQSAAIALGYYKVACNSMVDSFIIRSYKDDPGEAAMGLNFGIKGRSAFNVYKYMDTSKSLSYTKKYLKTIGVSSWSKAVPNFNKARLYKMFRIE